MEMIYLKQKLSASELVSIASMLFGMFFGAGNLIFPIALGQYAGRNMWIAFIGLVITAVGIPLLGVAAVGISRSDGLIELSGKVNRGYSVFFTCSLYLTIGPFFAIPRCAAVPFTIGVKPMLAAGAGESFSLAIFSAIFFIIVLGFSLFPGKILTWVGRILNPLFLIFLGVLVITALIKPMGVIHNAEPMGGYANGPFMAGFIEGYGTMDALASLAFGIVVITVIRDLGIEEPKAVAKNTVKAGFFSCLFMGIIYLAVTVVGAQSRGVFTIGEGQNGGDVFAFVANHYFGKVGAIILAVMVTFACLKTAVGLVTSCSETFCKLFPKALPYRAWAVIFSVVSFLIANIGLTSIIGYSLPVLMFLYPLSITLILLGIFGSFFGHSKWVYGFVTGFTLFEAIFDLLVALPSGFFAKLPAGVNPETIKAFACKIFPLFDMGLGWICPAFIGMVIGIIVNFAVKKSKNA